MDEDAVSKDQADAAFFLAPTFPVVVHSSSLPETAVAASYIEVRGAQTSQAYSWP